MTLVLGFDFETTGLDPAVDAIVEVGAVLWHWERKMPVRLLSQICHDESTPPISPGAMAVHGITEDDLRTYGKPTGKVLNAFGEMMSQSSAVMAHNAPFDISMYLAAEARYQLPYKVPQVIDTLNDLPLDHIKHESKKLIHLAATHDFVNPFPHRAVFDVLTMLKIASQYPLEDILRRAKAPNVVVEAGVDYDHNHLAKARGYRWEPAPVKKWTKVLKDFEVEKEANEAPFQIFRRDGK